MAWAWINEGECECTPDPALLAATHPVAMGERFDL